MYDEFDKYNTQPNLVPGNEAVPENEVTPESNVTVENNITPDSSVNFILRQPAQSETRQEQPQSQESQPMYRASQPAYQASQPQYQEFHQNAWQEIPPQQTPPKKPAKEKKSGEGKGMGYFRKMLVSVSLGLTFGICAALGFYGICSTTDLLDNMIDTKITERVDGNAMINSGLAKVETEQVSSSQVVESQLATTVTSDVSQMVENVMPAMVSIHSNYVEEFSYWGQTFTQESEGSGSGIIVGQNDTELLVATNYHVVADATGLQVTFVDNSTANAQLKGSDAGMDLAVIAIPLTELSNETKSAIVIATLGDSDELKLGEPTIAIGNALGYGQSVTTGVVSALDREIELSDGSTGTFIQTNAAINPGNSGGALLNIKGEVIGINSNKIGGSDIEGMGYAIPISVAKPIIAELMLKQTKIKVSEDQKGYLGITLVEVGEEDAMLYDMPQGIFITGIEEGSAAEMAGLMKRDIIVEFDGEDITSYEDLVEMLEYYAAGTTVDLTVMRGNNGVYEEITIPITLGSRMPQ